MKKVLLLSVAVFAFGLTAMAQSNSATATATAVIVSPITITKTADLSFGNIIADADGGTVVISTGGARTLNNITSPSVAGTISVATFTVTGLTGAAYTVGLPASHDISNGTQSMTVDSFQSDATGTLTGGTETIHVGATLTVGNNQAAGVYTNATGFTVTVNYN